jgi:undecaprenyl-diphosphatase
MGTGGKTLVLSVTALNLLSAIVLAIVEGITEFLPVSSTGHTILAAVLLGVDQTPFVKSFYLILEFGSIVAVVALYWRLFFNLEILKRLVVGVIPTGIIGLLVYRTFKDYLLGNTQVVLWALLLGGIFLIVFEWRYKERATYDDVAKIPYMHCFLIGLFQSISVIPGLSRSTATITGGLVLGLKRPTIVLYSFLLAVPTMIGASGFDLMMSYTQFSSGQTDLLAVGFITSFLVALVVIRLFLSYIRTRNFVPFGVYRVLVVVAFFILVIL